MKFKAKVSSLLVIFITVIYLVPVGLYFTSTKNIELQTAIQLPIIIYLLSFIGIIILIFGTYYSIDKSELKVYSAYILHKKIPIKSIYAIKKTDSWLAAPAPSFDRIEIEYGQKQHVVISLKDKINFIQTLKSYNSDIKVLE